MRSNKEHKGARKGSGEARRSPKGPGGGARRNQKETRSTQEEL